jgi:hypothetical protein
MEKILENTDRQLAASASESTDEYAFDFDFDADTEYEFEFDLELGEGYPDVELDENGEPIGCYTPMEIFDELDRKFVDFYGEEGRRKVNARRERWNKKGPHHYNLF